jgi:hypothetical protein
VTTPLETRLDELVRGEKYDRPGCENLKSATDLSRRRRHRAGRWSGGICPFPDLAPVRSQGGAGWRAAVPDFPGL